MRNKKGLLIIVVLVGLAGLNITGNQAGAQTPAVAGQTTLGGIEPQAGTWKPWVLATGRELRLPPPPDAEATRAEIDELRALAAQRDAAARHRITFWDAGAPSYRWVELALERILQGPVWGLNAARFVALVNVAMYDATIATRDSKYACNRPRPSELDPSLATALPNPRSPSYPSEHAATAGAASAVLAYLFPEDAKRFMDQAEEATQSRLLAGVEYPSDAQAGLELGRARGPRH